MNGAIEEQRVAMVVVGKRRESRGEKERDEEEASCSLPSSSLISSRNLGVLACTRIRRRCSSMPVHRGAGEWSTK